MLTEAERKKLAKAARELAGEYAEERGPELEPASWCGCAAGQMFRRAGIPNDGTRAARLDEELDLLLTSATSCQRNHYRPLLETPGAVVFPLLYVADWLEAQR